MKMLSLFAATAGLTLLGASPPRMDAPRSAGAGYPPCSRTVTDRCIQLYERGVASPDNLAMNQRLGEGRGGPRYARGAIQPPPGTMGERRIVVASNDYRPCRGEGDDRCIQVPAASPQLHRVAYDRQLVRVGERG